MSDVPPPLPEVEEVRRQRIRANRSSRAAAHDGAASVLVGAVPALQVPGDVLAGKGTGKAAAKDPVAQAVSAVCRAAGVTVDGPIVAAAAGDPVEAVRSTLRMAGVRTRAIRLDDDWPAQETGPFVAVTDAGAVVAVTLRPRGGWHITDFAASSVRRVDSAADSGLTGIAVVPVPGLGAAPSSVSGLVRLSLFGVRRDVSRVVFWLALGSLLGLVIPIANNVIFSEVVPGGQRQRLLVIGLVLVVLSAAAGAVLALVGRRLVRIRGRTDLAAGLALWDRLLRMPSDRLTGYTSGDLLERVLSVTVIRSLVPSPLIVAAIFGLAGASAIVLLFSGGVLPGLAVLSLWIAEVAALMLLVPAAARGAARSLTAQRGAQGRLLSMLNGIESLAVGQARERAFAQWAERYADQARAHYSTSRISSSMAMVVTVTPPLSVLLIVTTVFLAGGVISAPDFLMFTTAAAQVFAGTAAVGSLLGPVVLARQQLAQLSPLLHERPEPTGHRGGTLDLTGTIDVTGVTYSYRETLPPAVREVTISVRPGEFVALVGPSGSGKSTLLRLLLGLAEPSAGSIAFDGVELATLDAGSVRRQIGTVLQDTRLMPGSIAENIAAGRALTPEAIWNAARAAGLAADLAGMPMGVQTMITGDGGTLSGGQRQRVVIARALVGNPKVIIFDEATSALDNRAQATVTDYLAGLNVTRIVIAHRLSTIRNADRIYVMDQGRVVESGSYAELLAAQGMFARHAERQLAQ